MVTVTIDGIEIHNATRADRYAARIIAYVSKEMCRAMRTNNVVTTAYIPKLWLMAAFGDTQPWELRMMGRDVEMLVSTREFPMVLESPL